MSADSVDNKNKSKNKNKVVAQLPTSSTVGVTTYNPRDRSSADRMSGQIWRDATKEKYGESLDYDTATSGQRSAFEQKYGIDQPVSTGNVDPLAAYRDFFSGASGGGGGATAADTLARDQWNAQQGVAARALQGLQARLASGGYRGNADTLLGLIDTQNQQGQTAIQGNYDSGMRNINAGFDTAQGMINTGYGDLNKYLTANQTNPYAGLQQTVTPVNNAMANYLSAYGVSNDPVTQQVLASQISNQQGADSFNQLQQLMSANQLSNNQSNLDVSQMAQNYATTGLGSQRAGYQANADSARTGAMNELMSRINEARYGVEEGVGNRKSSLEESIIGAGGSLDGAASGSATSRAQQVASAPSNYPNFKAALGGLNPNYKFTTMAAAKKKFPALAKKFPGNKQD